MGIYRGPGGVGDAVNDASSEAAITVLASNEAIAAKNAALVAQTAAELAETNAETAQAAAASSAATSTTSATNSSTSASNAASSASAASTSASNAATSASNASTSATNAAAYELSANNWATKTSGPVAGGEYSSKYHAQLASTSASNASSSASSAASAQASAESARDATLAAYDSFDDRYLGSKTSNPTVDNDGNALVAGALYFNSVSGAMQVYTGSVWTAAYISGAGVLVAANNLSDLVSVSTARTNLGLGTAATTNSTAYATAAQGTNADTAYTDRLKWDGGATGLTASTGRTSLGVTATGADTTYAYRANNLSDLASASTARTNLGLGTAATTASSDYATAAQGTKADSALQAANIGSSVQAWDADLDAIAAITGTSGLLKKTAANTWSLDTNTYLTTAVSTVSVVSANGFTGTVANASTTPAITLTTSVSGLVKGNGTALSAATAGTDYVAPGTATTFTATQTFNGSSSASALKVLNITETAYVNASAPTATTNFYVNTGAVQYLTSNTSVNWTLNFAFSSGTSLNTAMATGDTISVTLMVTNSTTAYYPTAFTVDGTSVTPKWQGGTAPTSGNASSIDVYNFVLIKTASATYTILASQAQFK